MEKKKRDIRVGTRTAEPAVTMRRTTSDGIAVSVSILEDGLAEDSFCENEGAVLMSGRRNMRGTSWRRNWDFTLTLVLI